MSNTLLPCPFCGGEATTIDDDGGKYQAWCKHCCCIHMGEFYNTEAEAIAAWNRRTEQESELPASSTPTNAQRIRGMSDEELQKFLRKFESGDIDYAKTFCDLCCKDAALERRSVDCDGCLLWWLKNDAKQPQEGEGK